MACHILLCHHRIVIHRGNWFWWLVGAAIVAAILPAAAAVLAGVAVAILYLISLAVHPFMACRDCSATGRREGWLFGYAHRQCASCGGQGRHRRLGATVLYRGRMTWAERRAKDARDSRPNRPLL